jgi:hypothetical protein
MKGFADLVDLDEDERISLMAQAVWKGNVIGCAIDDDEEKIARYIEKMTAYDYVRHISTDAGLVPNTRTIRFGPVLDS